MTDVGRELSAEGPQTLESSDPAILYSRIYLNTTITSKFKATDDTGEGPQSAYYASGTVRGTSHPPRPI